MEPESVQGEKIRPGWGSYGAVMRLLGEALFDLVALPFRLLFFLMRRKKIAREIHRMLDDGSQEH